MKLGFKTATVAAFAAAVGLAFASPAQAAPSIYPGALLPGSSVLPGGSQMVSADFNGDGLMDLAVADDEDSSTSPAAGGVWVFLAKAGGGYAAPVFYPTASDPWTIAVGDLNGDGHPDIVTGNYDYGSSSSDQVSVLIGNGDGTFKTHVDYTAGTSGAESITVGDATGDGTADVVLGTEYNVLVIPGNGDGTLDTAAVQTLTLNNGSSYGVAVTDLNADGRPDIVATDGCSSGHDRVDVYAGQSGGTFLATPSQTVAVGDCPFLAVSDLNGDGAPDVAVANYYDSSVQVLLNSAGMLADSGTTYTLPADSNPYGLHLADVDGDGHVDILTANDDSDTVSILYGQGDGSFTAPTQVPMGAYAVDVAAVPAASGSAMNLVALDWPSSAFLTTARNLGSRSFYSYADYGYQNASGQGQDAYDMASTDFNGDGHPDLVIANEGDSILSVLLNTGQGGFGAPMVLTLPSGAGDIDAVAAGDVNGDGKADIVTADNSGHLYTFLGNGDDSFQAPVTSTIASSEVDGLALGDVNGDGTPDVAVAEYGANQVQICTGDGTGAFDCSAETPLSMHYPYRVKLTDLNGDGKLDLVATTGTADPTISGAGDAYVYLGDGTGGFGASPSATLPVVDFAWGIAVGDVNDDGHPDLVFGSGGNEVSVFTGNGDGTFGAAATYASGVSSDSEPYFVALADVNGDGHPDIVAANVEDGTLSLLTNQGNGTFNAAVNYGSGLEVYPVLALDVDGDGLPDIVAANYGDDSLANSTVSVYLHNHAPVATGTSLTVNENASGTGTVTATDAEQDPLTFAVATQPAHGTVSLDATSGSFTYTPTKDYSGSDSFTVTATNGLESSAPATVSITVTPSSSGGGGGSGGSGGGSSGGGGGALGLLSLLGLGLLLAPALRRRLG
ncbi:MAG: FG-GAP-like repeat-containing protein [Gammaproteobacteria bacterium]